MGDLVLGLATELMTTYDFGPTCVRAAAYCVHPRARSSAAGCLLGCLLGACWGCLLPQTPPAAPCRALHALGPTAPPPVSLHPPPCSFTSPFDVANKTTELLMLRGGVSCSCSDEGAIRRYEAQLAADRAA